MSPQRGPEVAAPGPRLEVTAPGSRPESRARRSVAVAGRSVRPGVPSTSRWRLAVASARRLSPRIRSVSIAMPLDASFARAAASANVIVRLRLGQDRSFCLSQSEQSLLMPREPQSTPVTSNTMSSSSVSMWTLRASRTAPAVLLILTIHVESKQCHHVPRLLIASISFRYSIRPVACGAPSRLLTQRRPVTKVRRSSRASLLAKVVNPRAPSRQHLDRCEASG